MYKIIRGIILLKKKWDRYLVCDNKKVIDIRMYIGFLNIIIKVEKSNMYM